jgi:hypothetical protein
MHVVEKRIGSQSRHRRKKCVIAVCQSIMTLAFEGPQSFRLAARQFCWGHNIIPWTQDRSTITAPGEGTSWHASLCPTDSTGAKSSNGLLSTACQPLPRYGKYAEYFPQNHGNRVFRGTAPRHAFAAKKPSLAARKIARTPVAFGSPQDFHIALMFGAARFGEPALSGSGLVGFRIAPRRRRLSRRSGTRHKCFNQHRILDATRPPRRAMWPKRLQQRGFSRASARLRPRSAFGLPQRA